MIKRLGYFSKDTQLVVDAPRIYIQSNSIVHTLNHYS